jgi:hypothetical protein
VGKKYTHTINKYAKAILVSSKKIGVEVSTTEKSDCMFMSHEQNAKKIKK